MSTGFPTADAQSDFDRARRARVLAALARRLRREPDDVGLILPFEEVVEALGRMSERDRGLQTVPLDSIVGTVDRTKDFDRRFRPTSPRVRGRWERIAAAQRRGQSMPPVLLYRIGDLHFVRDGHHRVSVARSLGREIIDAYVVEVITRVPAGQDITIADLPLKDHERLFHERVPLAAEQRKRIALADPEDFSELAESVEAWGMRAMQARGGYMDRAEVARMWFEEEYAPVVAMLRAAGLIGPDERETDTYLRIACARWTLLRTHSWSDEIVDKVARKQRRRRQLPISVLRRRR